MLTNFAFTKGQNLQKELDSLKGQNIDTVLVYSSYYTGTSMIELDSLSPDSCYIDDNKTNFIFWVKNREIYLKRIDNCFEYQQIRLNQFHSFNLIFSDFQKFKEEVIKKIVFKGRKRKSFIMLHGTYEQISLHFNKDTIYKSYYGYYMTMDRSRDNRININFQYNNQTTLKKVVAECKEVIKNVVFQKK
jgi:hypothetical protein